MSQWMSRKIKADKRSLVYHPKDLSYAPPNRFSGVEVSLPLLTVKSQSSQISGMKVFVEICQIQLLSGSNNFQCPRMSDLIRSPRMFLPVLRALPLFVHCNVIPQIFIDKTNPFLPGIPVGTFGSTKWSVSEVNVSRWYLPEVDEHSEQHQSPTVSPPLVCLAWESFSRTRHRRSSQAPQCSGVREDWEWRSAVGWWRVGRQWWCTADGRGWKRTRNSVSTRSAYNSRARCGEEDSTGGVELLFLLYHTIMFHKPIHLPCYPSHHIIKCKLIEHWWWYIVRICLTLAKGKTH